MSTEAVVRRWPARALVLAGLVLLAGCGAGADDDTGTTPHPDAADQESTTIGQPARDGSFEFTVSDVDCSQHTLGTPPRTVRAEGVYCLVAVAVTHVGDVPQALDVTAQRAYDAQQIEFSSNAGLTAYLPEDQVFPAELEPGAEASGVLVFDVPQGTDLTRLELHDAPFSAGVLVDLP